MIAWSGNGFGTRSDGPTPDLYRFDPATGVSERVFANPNRDSNLRPIAIGGRHFVFTELNLRLYGPSGWRLWYLAAAGGPAVLLDRADPPGGVEGPLPFAAVDAERVVWTTFHARPSGRLAELRMASLPTMHQTVLLSADQQRTEYWFPALDARRLVFARVEYNATRSADARHVYLLDLSQLSPEPRMLDATGDAANPAIHGDFVVWKRSNNELNWGSLVLHRLSTGVDIALDFGELSQDLDNASIGDRYLAAESREFQTLRLYDLTTQSTVTVQQWPAGGHAGAFVPHVAGNLLVFGGGVTDVSGPSDLRWIRLPPP